ncbi:hypothetical protein GQ457_02G043340 [Hibiscus cannabinus]
MGRTAAAISPCGAKARGSWSGSSQSAGHLGFKTTPFRGGYLNPFLTKKSHFFLSFLQKFSGGSLSTPSTSLRAPPGAAVCRRRRRPPASFPTCKVITVKPSSSTFTPSERICEIVVRSSRKRTRTIQLLPLRSEDPTVGSP